MIKISFSELFKSSKTVMAKISFSGIFRRRNTVKKYTILTMFQRQRKMRYLTILAFLIVCVAFGQMALFQGGKSTKAVIAACNITGTGIRSIPADCENQDVVIAGATVDAGIVQVWSEAGKHNQCSESVINPANGKKYNFKDFYSSTLCNYENWSWSGGSTYYKKAPIEAYHTVGQLCNSIYIHGTTYSTCDSKRHFKSLIIQNSGVLTHNELTTADFNDAVAGDPLNASGSRKKVDIEVAGDIVLESGGQINVDGKGYPGGGAINVNGYGSGFGLSSNAGNGNGDRRGGGGAYGGNGEAADSAGGTKYPVPYSANMVTSMADNLRYGSGSGYVRSHKGSLCGGVVGLAPGVHGGGYIHIVSPTVSVSNTSFISANGAQGNHGGEHHSCGIVGSDTDAYSGGGGGGLIWLQADYVDFPIGVGTSPISVEGSGDTLTEGTQYLFQTVGNPPTNISANGGISGGGHGGGGRIVIGNSTSCANSVSIKKTLVAVNRAFNATPVNAAFNPYALQYNDRISVDLEVSNLIIDQLVTVTDNFLWNNLAVPNSVACSGSIHDVSGGGTKTASSISWTITPTDAIENLSYECTVQ